jgi:hypothetical protein
MEQKGTFHVRCTCCEAILTVDKSSGEVLFTEKPKKKSVSFEDAVMKVQHEKESAEDRFKEAFQREQGRMQLVDKKFEEAMKHADELEEPIRPLDLD